MRSLFDRSICGMTGAILVLLTSSTLSAADRAAISFERDIAPIFIRRCLECHNEREASGKLVLSEESGAFKGGESGQAIVPGQPDKSVLFAKVDAGEMPPVKRGHSQKLSKAEIQALRDWIASGAAWPEARKLDAYESTTEVRGGRDWWSLQPVRRPAVPRISSSAVNAQLPVLRSPIDAFVVSQLVANSMEPAPPADRATLIKRVSFDLLGLPPSYDEVEAFVHDPAPDAYERLIDRLIASPHFGERWARYWLDLVRYADTCGYERDQEKPGAWKYRDWIVRAINDDMPLSRFIIQQLAGDELSNRNEDSLIATGFLRVGTWNDEPNDAEEYKYDRLEDLVGATSTAFLGMTVKCARCHDHKFDPIPQTDYYRMAAAFWPGPIEARGRELLGGPSREELDAALGQPPSAVFPLNKQQPPDILAWTDVRPAPPLHLLKKGEPKHPGPVVEPAAMSFVSPLAPPIRRDGAEQSSHRRTELAEWIAHSNNPLTTRVFVNRLWTHHFGSGLVRSADNFGFTGEKPTHPELLDWLSAELGAGVDEPTRDTNEAASVPRSLKRLHRLLVSSATYRQSSLHPRQNEYFLRDAANRLWWRAERRRLDAESLRDRMLIVGDNLDTRMGGPGFKVTIQAEALEGLSRKDGAWKPSPPQEQLRRSLYSFSARSLLPPLMTTFDFGDTTLPCGQRQVSTVAPQALALLNNAFAHERSAALARRIMKNSALSSSPFAPPLRGEKREETKTADAIIRAAWRHALMREPSPSQLEAARHHLMEQRRRFANGSLAESINKSEHNHASTVTLYSGLSSRPVLHLRADTGVTTDDKGRVIAWTNASGNDHSPTQSDPARRPLFVKDAAHGRPALRFDGQRRFLHLNGQVLTSQSFAIFAVVTDRATTNAHREIFSNWNGAAGNSGTSLFLGMTGEDTVRLSDDFSGIGHVARRAEPFLLSGFNSPSGATVYQNDLAMASKGGPLSPRNLTTAYVIGQQGNIDGEYWHGDLFELLVFNNDLSDQDRRAVERSLLDKYHLPRTDTLHDPDFLALASLCHVLLNTNEFAYVD